MAFCGWPIFGIGLLKGNSESGKILPADNYSESSVTASMSPMRFCNRPTQKKTQLVLRRSTINIKRVGRLIEPHVPFPSHALIKTRTIITTYLCCYTSLRAHSYLENLVKLEKTVRGWGAFSVPNGSLVDSYYVLNSHSGELGYYRACDSVIERVGEKKSATAASTAAWKWMGRTLGLQCDMTQITWLLIQTGPVARFIC